MHLTSIKLLLVLSSLSLIGGLVQSDKKQDNPPKKNNIAVVVDQFSTIEKENISDMTEKMLQERKNAQEYYVQIVEESKKKREETELLHEKNKEKAMMAQVSDGSSQMDMMVSQDEMQQSVESNPVSQTQPDTVSQQQGAARSSPATPSYQAMSIYIGDIQIPYQNGGQGSGQAIIDSNPYGTASTWGGAAVQNGADGLSTHFIGHNPGIFASIFQLGIGQSVIVTDGAGVPTTYIVNQIYQVDDYAVEIGSGRDLWNVITGSGNGEQVVFQACINDYINLIVIAVK